jgi:hypothetical protein
MGWWRAGGLLALGQEGLASFQKLRLLQHQTSAAEAIDQQLHQIRLIRQHRRRPCCQSMALPMASPISGNQTHLTATQLQGSAAQSEQTLHLLMHFGTTHLSSGSLSGQKATDATAT